MAEKRLFPVIGPDCYTNVLCKLLHTSLSAKLLLCAGDFWIEAPYFLAQWGDVE